MPTVVQIDCPPAQLSLRIDLGNVEINRLVGRSGGRSGRCRAIPARRRSTSAIRTSSSPRNQWPPRRGVQQCPAAGSERRGEIALLPILLGLTHRARIDMLIKLSS